MKIILVLFTFLSLLVAKDKLVVTKAQLVCLSKKIDRYLNTKNDFVLIILENKCEKKSQEEKLIFSNTKNLPDFSSIKVDKNSSKAVSADDVVLLEKKEAECLKKNLPRYLKTEKDKIEISLKCQ